MALTDCITAHGATARALLSFEQLRLQPGQEAVGRARRLGAYMQAHASSGTGENQLVRDAHDVMMETAIDLSVTPEAPARASDEVHA